MSDIPEDADPGIKVLFAVDGCAVSFSLALLTGQVPSINPVYVISHWDPGNRLLDVLCHRADDRDCGRIPNERGDLNAVSDPLKVEFCLLSQMTRGLGGADLKLRTRAIFVCRFTSHSEINSIVASIASGAPIQTDLLITTLSEYDTFRLHDDFNIALHISLACLSQKRRNGKEPAKSPDRNLLSIMAGTFSGGRRGLAGLYLQYEQKVTAAYRRVYGGSTTTAFWYVSKFGPEEKSLVLALRYYLLQAQAEPTGIATGYDLQAIKDICDTYAVPVEANPTGFSTADLTSFARLSRFCCVSNYANGPVARAFPLYVEHRIAADVTEVDALKEYIERDRSGLKISDLEFVKYIYLAYFECYNRAQLRRHLRDVTVRCPEEDVYKRSSLGKHAVDNFFTHVRSRLNVNDHIACNVSPDQVEMGNVLTRAFCRARTYPPSTMESDARFTGICEPSSVIIKRLDALESTLHKYGWPRARSETVNMMSECANLPIASSADSLRPPGLPLEHPGTHCRGGPMIVKRLLALVSADARVGDIGPTNMLTGIRESAVKGPLPIYRIGMSKGKQAFAVMVADCWDKIIPSPGIVKAHLSKLGRSGRAPEDDVIARDIFFTSELERVTGHAAELPYFTCGPAEEQQYINRNEVFNDNLIVGNIILDVDVHLRTPVPVKLLHVAMRGFRTGALKALSLLLPKAKIDHGSYPCYFYKTSCKKSRVVHVKHWMSSTTDFALDCDGPAVESADCELEMGFDDPLLMDQIDDSISRCESDASSLPSDADLPCNCHEKIGLRVCIPVPPPYLLVGSRTMSGLARVLQQSVLLERSFVEPIGSYLKNYDIVDSGVYGHGRSLRLPFFGKIDETGLISGRLLPFCVIPERCGDAEQFVLSHLQPKTFHFHSPMPEEDHASVVLKGLGGEYAGFFEKKITINRDTFFGIRLSLAVALKARGVDINDSAAIVSFVTEHILDDIIQYMHDHIPDHAAEYNHVSVSCCVIRPDWILLQLMANKTLGRAHGFTCVRFKHTRTTRMSSRSYLSLNIDAHGRLCACVIQQCFAAKCGNNKLRTLFTVDVDSKCQAEHR